MPSKKDVNLELARDVLRLLPSKNRSVAAREILNSIFVIELSIDLGSQRLPATFRFCDPESLLQEVVKIGTNYKQVY